jgi:hypothetical protein
MNKLIILFALLLIIPMGSADLKEQEYGTCNQISIPLNSTTANITSISTPNGFLIINAQMTLTNTIFNYTYCNSEMGRYDYSITDNEGNTYGNSFLVTADGKPYQNFPISYSLILLGLVFLVFGKYFGRKFNTSIFDFFSGIFFMISGILTLTQGFNFTNWSTLDGLALGTIFCGIGAIIMYNTSEVFD